MDDLTLSNMKNSINQLKTIYNKHEELLKQTGEKFNIFSILNMERLEVRTHSAFLYELLNPKGSHYQGYEYLKLFIEIVLKIEDFNFENIVVDKERNIKELGRVDLVIENKERLIIIEMKIDAGDQEQQLKRYSDYGKRTGKEYKIYYLTLFGTDASDYSTGVDESIEYNCISFASDILHWLDSCIRAYNTPFLTSIREILRQYSKLVKKITNQVDGGLAMDIKEFLLKDGNLEIIDEVTKVIPYAKAEVEFNFWCNLYEKCDKNIEELGYKFIGNENFPTNKNASIDDIVEARKGKNGEYDIDYLIGFYKKFEVRLLIANGWYDNHIYASLALVDNEGNYVSYEEYDEEILNIIIALGFDQSGDIKYKYLEYDLNFQDNYIYKLVDKEYMDESVERIGNEVLNIFKTINKSSKLKRLLNKRV
ncbi:MAG: hypothetical protein ACI8WT_003854 [Clostridium sp.]|jgi:hypothetical protein